MKTLSPKVIGILFVFLGLFIFNLQAQAQKVISSTDNGKVVGTYQIKDNQFQVTLLYKNDQYIYTPEMDSVVLKTKDALQSFINDFNKGVASLDQKELSYTVQRTDCRLFKYLHSMNGAFLSISNASGGVVTSQNKWEAQQLLDWMLGIQWGKE